MRPLARALATAALGLSLVPSLAQAKVQITVDLDHQTIHVAAKDQSYDWKVSSGKAGYETPVGKFSVLWMDKDHHSDEYEQAPMPDSIFFAPGYAIHGFGRSAWGHAVSHGCVRLPVSKAAILFDLVKAEGADITIIGHSPVTKETIAAARQKQQEQTAAAAVQAQDAAGAYDVAPGAPDAGYADAGPYDYPVRQRGPAAGPDVGSLY